MTRRRRLALALAALLGLLAGLAAAVAWVVTTEAGLHWAAGVARGYLPAGVSFERAEGRLIGPLTLTGVTARGADTRVHLGRVELDWRPWALLTSEIRLSRLDVRGVDVDLGGARGAGPLRLRAPAADLGLPARVVLEQVAVEDVSLRWHPDGQLGIDAVALAARAGPDRLRLSRLRVQSTRFAVDGRLRLDLHAPHEVHGRIDWRARPGGAIAAMAGTLELGGRLADLRLDQRWHDPAEARVDARVQPFGAAPSWHAELDLPPGPLTAWSQELPELEAAADLRLEGTFETVAAEGALDVAGLAVGPLRARGRVRASPAGAEIAGVRVEPADTGAWVDVSGNVAWAEAIAFDLRARWRGLGWPLDDPAAGLRSPGGRLALHGAPADYAVDGSARLVTPWTGSDPVRVDASGRGSLAALTGLRLTGDWRGAHLEGEGDLRWAEPGHARARLRVSGIDPARLVDGPPGGIEAAATVELDWGAPPAGRVTVEHIGGELDGRPVGGGGRVAYADGVVRVEALRLVVADARLEASGTYGAAADLDWRVEVPALERLAPPLHGGLAGSGRVTGPADEPVVAVDVAAAELAAAGTRLQRARLTGRFAPLGGADGRLELELAGAAARAVTVESLRATLAGSRGDHRLEVAAGGDRGRLELALTGGADDGGWAGRLERATLEPTDLGPWVLTAPAPLAWRDAALRLARACWRRADATVCIAAAGGAAGWRAEVEANAVPVAWIGSQWRPDLDYQGRASGSAVVSQRTGAALTGRGRIELTAGAVAGVLDDERTTLLAYEPGHLEAELGADRMTAAMAVPLADGGRLDARVELGRSGERPLNGRVRARVDDLALLTVVVPQVGRAEGRLVADLRVGGHMDAPSLSGTAALEEGRLVLDPLGVDLRGLEASVATADGAFEVRAAARSGAGRATADLRLERGSEGWRGAGRISGQRFTALDLPELRAVVSPDLQWRLDGRDIGIDGSVAVTSARIEPRDLSRAVQASSDAVVLGPDGEPVAPDTPAWRVSADVRVTVGDDVRIDAFGLVGRLVGELSISERPEQLTTATGELRVVDGEYSIYRQTLRIERGRVLFDGGPVANPGLDMRAVRRPRDVVVGVHVRGSLREPRVELFSEPPMQESQVLSYLIAGVPLGDASAGEHSTLATAAGALAGSREGRQLASQLGVEEVTVEGGGEAAGPSVVLGRYLSPQLYVGYGIGLAEQVNSVRMRYDLTEHWSLEARSGATSSADMLYTIESESTAGAREKLVPD